MATTTSSSTRLNPLRRLRMLNRGDGGDGVQRLLHRRQVQRADAERGGGVTALADQVAEAEYIRPRQAGAGTGNDRHLKPDALDHVVRPEQRDAVGPAGPGAAADG